MNNKHVNNPNPKSGPTCKKNKPFHEGLFHKLPHQFGRWACWAPGFFRLESSLYLRAFALGGHPPGIASQYALDHFCEQIVAQHTLFFELIDPRDVSHHLNGGCHLSTARLELAFVV